MSRPRDPSNTHLSERSAQALTGLPALLDTARTILAVAFEPGDTEADDLRQRIEECAVDAHRLLLRLRIEAPQHAKPPEPADGAGSP